MEFIWNKCSAYLKQTEPKSAKRPGVIKPLYGSNWDPLSPFYQNIFFHEKNAEK